MMQKPFVFPSNKMTMLLLKILNQDSQDAGFFYWSVWGIFLSYRAPQRAKCSTPFERAMQTELKTGQIVCSILFDLFLCMTSGGPNCDLHLWTLWWSDKYCNLQEGSVQTSNLKVRNCNFSHWTLRTPKSLSNKGQNWVTLRQCLREGHFLYVFSMQIVGYRGDNVTRGSD